jgi:hypothetical protein
VNFGSERGYAMFKPILLLAWQKEKQAQISESYVWQKLLQGSHVKLVVLAMK